MKNSVDAVAADAPFAGRAGEPSAAALLVIFWAAFAAAAAFVQLASPDLFLRTDPDSVLRLVGVRDLIAGQAWFDLVQHRMDPPAGVLMHWSRLIDAPLAGLVLLGAAFFGGGELFALTVWPLLLLLAFMAGCLSAAMALAGRAAALPALLLTLTFFYPLLSFLPNSIDHHNAQIALTLATLASALRLCARPLFGLAAGFAAALMLAIGLETLLYVAVFGAAIAVAWAATGQGARGTALFGAAFAVAPAGLYLAAGSPAASGACDSLSWTYAVPAAIAGGGLAALAGLMPRDAGTPLRLAGLMALALLAGGSFILIAPECRYGPYGFLSAELHALFLGGVSEAQPLLSTFRSDPAGMIASIAAPLLACAIAGRRAWHATGDDRRLWALPAVLIAASVLLSFHQQRAIPYANAVAIPVLAAWIAELAAHYRVGGIRPLRHVVPVLAAFVLAMPLVHLGIAWAAVGAVSLATGGRIAPVPLPEASGEDAGLNPAEQDCIDPASAALLASVPDGLVLTPLFYGPSVLSLSRHSVVAGPYHRAERAILDTIRAMNAAPDAALAIVRRRGVDYIALCTTSSETAMTVAEAPQGLLARLAAGEDIAWLEPVASSKASRLSLFHVMQ